VHRIVFCRSFHLALRVIIGPIPTSDSNTSLRVGVSKIGRRPLSMNLGGLIFGTAVIFACFNIVGTTPSTSDELKMKHSGSHTAKAKSRKNQFGKQSGSGALRSCSLANPLRSGLVNSPVSRSVSRHQLAGLQLRNH
jgi:hypothetical protein